MSSIVECLPLVQGGIVRNSSNVRTRGLQHFQPACRSALCGDCKPQAKRAPIDLSGLRGRLEGLDDTRRSPPDL